jgi:hypothetical protein
MSLVRLLDQWKSFITGDPRLLPLSLFALLRSLFFDKQLIRVQETPDEVPEGLTLSPLHSQPPQERLHTPFHSSHSILLLTQYALAIVLKSQESIVLFLGEVIPT